LSTSARRPAAGIHSSNARCSSPPRPPPAGCSPRAPERAVRSSVVRIRSGGVPTRGGEPCPRPPPRRRSNSPEAPVKWPGRCGGPDRLSTRSGAPGPPRGDEHHQGGHHHERLDTAATRIEGAGTGQPGPARAAAAQPAAVRPAGSSTW
jgi:hypothetical protein